MTTIVHTTDLGADARSALIHSVALARSGAAHLISLHANAPEEVLGRIPDAASVLSAWGDAPDAVEFSKRVHNCCDDPVETILDAIGTIEPDLVVATTHPRGPLSRFVAGSRAEAISHNVTAPVLVVGTHARGFVAAEDGTIALRRVLVPIGDPEEAQAAVSAAGWLASLAGCDDTEFILLHIGAPRSTDTAALAAHPGWTVRHVTVPKGSVEAVVADQAEHADLVVMATRGHDSLHDVLLGSHTDDVLHRASCPVLSVRVGS
jgi:nucleotide-binding universal stress UspA family protein